MGCGLGANAVWFAARGFRVVGVDYRPKVVDEARAIAASLALDCQFETADAFDLSAYRGFDLAISFGVIEHWDRPDTVRALREQTRASRRVAAVIPTPNTRYTGQITDERFYSRRALRKLFREAGLTDVTSHGYGNVPSPLHRSAELVLPTAAIKALRAVSKRFSMAQVAFGLVPEPRG